jgi:hypothetical protein
MMMVVVVAVVIGHEYIWGTVWGAQQEREGKGTDSEG